MAIEIGTVNADTSVKLGSTTIQSGYIGFNQFYNTYTSILDLYPTSVHHAYSLRKLRSTYTGKCLRVRRTTTTPSITSTTVDLDFDVFNTISLQSKITYVSGTATIAKTLGEFCASVVNGHSNPDSVNTNQNIFVVTWFDQSGNGKNPTNATAGQQPRLVNAGNLETSGGKVAVRNIKSSNNILTIVDTTANINNMSSYWVGQYVTTITNNIGYSLSAANTVNRFYFPAINIASSAGIYAAYSGTIVGVLLDNLINTDRKLFELISPLPGSTTLVQGWTNGSAKGTIAISSGTTASITLGGSNTTNSFDGYIQEVIGWQSNLNRVEKETNINSYWTIY